MNCYIALISKKGAINIEMENKVKRVIRQTLFDYTEPLESVEYSYSRKSALFLFSIRGEKMRSDEDFNNPIYNRYAFSSTGYPIKNKVELLDNNGCDKKCVSELGGVFSICVLDKKNDEIRAYNNHMRLENIFMAENDDYYFVGTRALALHMLSSSNTVPELDKSLLISFLHRGYFPCEGTPFKGVSDVPIYSEIKVNLDGMSISPIEDLSDKYFSRSIDSSVCDEMTDELLRATEMIKENCKKAKIGLTGGKDSRMMVLAMTKAGIDLDAETGGYDDSPDVIVARRIADILKINHSTYHAKEQDGIIEIDLLERAQKMAFASDCMMYAFEGCGSSYGSKYSEDFSMFNGLGGEILRGGYAKRLKKFTKKEVNGKIERLYHTVPHMFLPDIDAEYRRKIDICLNGFSKDEPESMDWLYINEHMGKWASVTMRCWGMKRQFFMPLCDQRLIKKALTIKTMDKLDDRMIFEIIKRLDSRFTNIPLADARWAFEKDGPSELYKEGYDLREPVTAKTKLGAFNWRDQSLTDMRENMKSVIFDSRCSEIFDILDKKQVEKLFSKDNEEFLDNRFNKIFAWYIYSAAVMLEGSWYKSHKGAGSGFSGNDMAREIAKISVPRHK